MEAQAKRTLTTKKVIKYFKEIGTNLSEEEAEQSAKNKNALHDIVKGIGSLC